MKKYLVQQTGTGTVIGLVQADDIEKALEKLGVTKDSAPQSSIDSAFVSCEGVEYHIREIRELSSIEDLRAYWRKTFKNVWKTIFPNWERLFPEK